MTLQEQSAFNPEAQLMREVGAVIAPLAEVIDLDLYAKALHEAAAATEPTDRVVSLSDYASVAGFFAESGGSVVHTPLAAMPNMPAYAKGFVKRDNLQPIGAYKLRGGQLRVNRALHERPGIQRFVTGSAGNAALAMALAVANHNRAGVDSGGPAVIEAHVFAKKTMSPVKRDQLEQLQKYGVVLHADYDDLDSAICDAELAANTDFGRLPAANEDETRGDSCFVAPFNHYDVMAGQATLMLETLADLIAQGVDLQQSNLRVLVPVGGGGLLAGTIAALEWAKQQHVVSETAQAVGVQLEQCDAAARDFYNEPPLTAETLNTNCDGTAVLASGEKTKALIRQYAGGFIRLTEAEVGRGMDYLQYSYGDLAEPAGALAPTALLLLAESLPETTELDRDDVLVGFSTGHNATPQLRRHFRSQNAGLLRAAFRALSEKHLERRRYGVDEVAARKLTGSLGCSGTVVFSGFRATRTK